MKYTVKFGTSSKVFELANGPQTVNDAITNPAAQRFFGYDQANVNVLSDGVEVALTDRMVSGQILTDRKSVV